MESDLILRTSFLLLYPKKRLLSSFLWRLRTFKRGLKLVDGKRPGGRKHRRTETVIRDGRSRGGY